MCATLRCNTSELTIDALEMALRQRQPTAGLIHHSDYQMPMALAITIRKLLENLVIDILRKKYGTAGLTLYYDQSRRRFNDFSVLLKNLDAKKGDFHYITSSLDKSFISDLNRYKETGNSGAHSIDTNLVVERFTAEKDRIKYLVQLLLKVFQRL